MILGVSSKESGHAGTVAVAHPEGEIGGVNAFVAETNENASLPAVFGKGKETEVGGMVVGGVTVRMVCGHAFWDELVVFGDVRGMGGREAFNLSKSIFKT